MNNVYDYDLFVIGGGSGGVRCARISAGHGARVAIAEEYRWGGTCVIRGCVPKKLMVYASEVRDQLRDARGFGWTIGASTFDWSAFIAAKDREITRLSGIYLELLTKAGVTIFDGAAKLDGPNAVIVAGQRVTAERIVIATGGTPAWPSASKDGWISSNEAFHLPSLPVSVAIYGGGYIAVEFAHIFAGMGAKVSLIHRDRLVLRGFDEDVRTHVALGLARAGITLHAGCTVVSNEADDASRLLTLSDGTKISTAIAMAATGRVPATAALNLSSANVAVTERGAVIVNEYAATSSPSVFAIGDVTDRVTLTPIAIREGHALADTLFDNKPTPVDHHGIASGVFCQPPAAVVGLGEAAAVAAGHDVQVFRSVFRPMRHTLAGRDDKVLMKLVIDRQSRKVLGAHMVGADAPEIIQMAAIAITMGATKDDFDRTVAVHPTAAEEFVLMRG
jgi:glutathione reductase (NADPH)